MNRRPKIGFHKITRPGGEVLEIMVLAHIEGETTAFLFKFHKTKKVAGIPKSRLHLCQVMQFYKELEGPGEKALPPGWAIADQLNPLLVHPIKAVSWE